MTRFVSELLDLSRLAPPEAIRGINQETILAERRARLVEVFDEYDIEYDGDLAETDLSVVLQNIDGERENRAYAAINDAVRSVILAFAEGATLEHLGSLLGVARLEGEKDTDLRDRIHYAPDAYGTAGSEGAYIYWARTADVRVTSAVALGPSINGLKPGQVNVVIATDAVDQTSVLDAVTRKLFSRDVKPLTDMLSVRLAHNVRYSIAATIDVPRGPDPGAVLAEARTRLDAYLAARRRIGAVVALSGVSGALHVAAADRVSVTSPLADIDPGADGLAVCDEITITTRVVGA
jgi:phage-related baseplate assembly protein